jgi:cytochrome P450
METPNDNSDPYAFFDPYGAAFNRSPDATYQRLRELPSPFYWQRGGAWVATTYEHITTIQQDRRFSTNIADSEHFDASLQKSRSDISMRLQGIMGGTGETHIQLKKLLMPFFLADGITRIEPYMHRKIAERLAALRSRRSFDIVDDYAKHLPIAIVSHILGVPEALHDDFYTFAIAFLRLFAQSYSSLEGDAQTQELQQRVAGGVDVIRELIDRAAHRGNGPHGVIAALVDAQQDGLALNDDQLVSVIGEIIAGGADTTVLAICHTVNRLLQRPDLLRCLKEMPALWPGAVQEILRYESVIKLGIRFPVEDVALGDAQICKGQMTLFVYGAGLRDPAVFPQPDTFDIERDHSKSIAFGRSGHACIGRHLAIAETCMAVRLLLEEFPTLQQSVPAQFNNENRVLREMLSLPVTIA